MSEREQVWRERIEWQQWSGLTVAESLCTGCCSDICHHAEASLVHGDVYVQGVVSTHAVTGSMQIAVGERHTVHSSTRE